MLLPLLLQHLGQTAVGQRQRRVHQLSRRTALIGLCAAFAVPHRRAWDLAHLRMVQATWDRLEEEQRRMAWTIGRSVGRRNQTIGTSCPVRDPWEPESSRFHLEVVAILNLLEVPHHLEHAQYPFRLDIRIDPGQVSAHLDAVATGTATELMNPFRSVPALDLQEKIESIAFAGNHIYVGTAVGGVFQFSLPAEVDSADDKDLKASQVGVARLSRRPVEQVKATERFVFALLDSVLYALPRDVQTAAPVEICKDVKRLCLHTGSSGEEVSAEVCVATRKKLLIFAHNGVSFEQRQARL
eukprot:g26221.t1